jgi:hypothetical protein
LTFIPHVIVTNYVIFRSVFEISSESQFLMEFPRRKFVFFFGNVIVPSEGDKKYEWTLL